MAEENGFVKASEIKPEQEYLSIRLAGHNTVYAYPVPACEREKPTDPHFRGQGVAVWVNKRTVLKVEKEEVAQ